MKRILTLTMVFISLIANAQKKSTPQFTHVEPPFWWTGMKNDDVQVLFHDEKNNLQGYTPTVEYPGVTVKEVKRVENPHYLFLILSISNDAKPGIIPISFAAGKKKLSYSYELKEKSATGKQGFTSSDVLYLIMPDRFSNGDKSNDSIPGMLEGAHRANPGARHGGDLKGIENHLDYISNLGVTALWLNPVLENNQRAASYHGYAITDLYQVDRRFGTNADYLRFIEASHAKGLKVIQDMVMNHIGNEHWLLKDAPEKNWVHNFPSFTRSNYRSSVMADPHQSKADFQKMNDGWFDTTMPDVDQTNELFATYLIQNTLWWIEYGSLDGIRMDTYPYNDKAFMARWAKEVREEYPQFGLVGEVWINNVSATAYWQDGTPNKDGYKSFLPSVTDFPLYFKISEALNEQGSWDTGLVKLYEVLSLDFCYPDANNNLIFLDNHDLSRFYFSVKKDLRKYKMGLAFLLTTRGIPQLYYGSELLMDGDGNHHPQVRLDFPGGWPEDKVSAFTASGRTADQNEAVDYLTRLLQWRKSEPVIHSGKLTHYVPEDNVYVYFRHDSQKTVMVILNGNEKSVDLNTSRFQENIRDFQSGIDIIDKRPVQNLNSITVAPMSARIIELKSEALPRP